MSMMPNPGFKTVAHKSVGDVTVGLHLMVALDLRNSGEICTHCFCTREKFAFRAFCQKATVHVVYKNHSTMTYYFKQNHDLFPKHNQIMT